MASAFQDSSIRGIFQKAKSKKFYDQEIEEKQKAEICKNFLFKGSCKYSENRDYIQMRISKQNYTKTIINLELVLMDQNANIYIQKQKTRQNCGVIFRNNQKRIQFHLLFPGISKKNIFNLKDGYIKVLKSIQRLSRGRITILFQKTLCMKDLCFNKQNNI
ncbi:unnamed protein product [Paramecium sonneborni]|uniref:C3H1-type domain-containing protein n=1 Tax=Paramecium sonneborni TaxID=65129 RepID=A0A8S1K0A6_9CILI|nr:unnamed protein product [Paramecium sonneborni]